MHLKIIVVVVLAALFAAGLGYGLLRIKDREVVSAEVQPEQMVPPALVAQDTPAVAPVMPSPQGVLPPVPMPAPGQPPGMNAGAQLAVMPGQPPMPFPSPMNSPVLQMPGEAPRTFIDVSQIPADSPLLPPDALAGMPVQDKQVYFEYVIRILPAQKDLSVKYFTQLILVEEKYRQVAMRTIQRMQKSYAPPGSIIPPMGGMSQSLEDQIKESEAIQVELKKAIDARAALMAVLTKEQLAKIKIYTDMKIL